MIFLENLYLPLLLIHLLATFVLIGSATHNLLCVTGYVRGKFGREKLEQRFIRTMLWSYAVVYLLGALIYPAYRIYIRRDYFDPVLPWASGLFEIKIHWSAVGLALVVVYYLLRRSFRPSEEKEKLFLYVPLCLLVNIIVWYTTVIGGYLTCLKGSW